MTRHDKPEPVRSLPISAGEVCLFAVCHHRAATGRQRDNRLPVTNFGFVVPVSETAPAKRDIHNNTVGRGQSMRYPDGDVVLTISKNYPA